MRPPWFNPFCCSLKCTERFAFGRSALNSGSKFLFDLAEIAVVGQAPRRSVAFFVGFAVGEAFHGVNHALVIVTEAVDGACDAVLHLGVVGEEIDAVLETSSALAGGPSTHLDDGRVF